MRIAVKFGYDGRAFHGYARQPNLKTVEGELIKILVKKGIIKNVNKNCFRSASRTDKGVSALGNVVAFNTKLNKDSILQKLSEILEYIYPYGIAKVESTFNPRYAKYRYYRYYLHKDRVDVEKIIKTAAVFIGEHDFSNFARVEPSKNPVRIIDNIVFTNESDLLIIDFFAQTFLWHQIRRIISALVKIGNGKLTEKQVAEALSNPDKKVDFGLAPAESLVLKDIVYNFEFEYDKKSLTKIHDFENNLMLLLSV